jgi:hypothetical protein
VRHVFRLVSRAQASQNELVMGRMSLNGTIRSFELRADGRAKRIGRSLRTLIIARQDNRAQGGAHATTRSCALSQFRSRLRVVLLHGEPLHVRRIVGTAQPGGKDQAPTIRNDPSRYEQCNGPFYMLISCRNTVLPNALFAYPGGAQHGLGRFSF